MKKLSFLPLVALVLATQTLPSCAQTTPEKSFFFRDGDRAMITGDSITEQRQYSTLIESFVLSRFPNWKISFRNTGWSGDTAAFVRRGGQENGLRRDILSLNPTAVTIDYGMNDARAGEAGVQSYVDSSRGLVEALTKAGARVALITSSPEERYETGQPAGSAYNEMLRRYSQGLKGVAAEKNAVFVDQLNPMIQTIEAGRAAGTLSRVEGGPRLIPDAIHPQWAGHLVMATHILKGLSAPSLVSRVEIDVQNRRGRTEGANVTDIDRRRILFSLDPNIGTYSFLRTDNSLPWPIHPETKLALDIPNFKPLDELSRYELKVTNLPQPKYEISIGGQSIGTFTREQLSAGVNLSNNAGPITVQSQALLQKIIEKNNVFYDRWRRVQIYNAPQWLGVNIETARAAELSRLDAQIAALEREIDVLRQPKPHVWSLKPVA